MTVALDRTDCQSPAESPDLFATYEIAELKTGAQATVPPRFTGISPAGRYSAPRIGARTVAINPAGRNGIYLTINGATVLVEQHCSNDATCLVSHRSR